MKNPQQIFQEANNHHANEEYTFAINKYRIVIGQLLKLPKSGDREFNLAATYLNLGNSYKENEQFRNAEKYFNKALDIYNKLQDNSKDCRKQIAWSYNNIASSYLMQRKFETAYKYNQRALVIRQKLFEESPQIYGVDYLMSLFNLSLSNHQLNERDKYISSLKLFISKYEEVQVKDANAEKFYEDAKLRLKFAMNTDFEKLKSKDELEKELPRFVEKYTSLEGFEPSPEKALEILQEFREICGGTIVSSQVRDGLEQFYFRVRNRKTMNEGDEFDPSQFSHPPAQFTGHGRVNLCRHPVFYGGEKIEVVVQETHIKEGEEFYLSFWRSGGFFPNYAMMHSSKTNSERLDLHKSTRDQQSKDNFKAQPNLIAESFEYIFDKLSELFTIDDWTISSSLGYSLLYKDDKYDGIEYPDVKTRTSYNFALKPQAAAKLKLYRVYLCRLESGDTKFIETGEIVEVKVKYKEYCEEDHPFNLDGVRIYKERKKNAR